MASPFNKVLLYWLRLPNHPAKLRLFRYVWKVVGSPLLEVPFLEGTLLRVDPTDYIGKTIIWNGSYEVELYRFITSVLDKNAVFIDIGCNIGCFSIPVAKKCRQVYAVDANPLMTDIISDTARLNNLRNVLVHTTAISNYDGVAEFFVADNGNMGISSLNSDWAKSLGCIEVPVMSLNSFISGNKLKKVDVIKIDAEGESANAILGAKEVLHRIKCLIFEVSPGAAEVVELLQSLGFEIDERFRNFTGVEKNLADTIIAHNKRSIW